MQQIEKIFTEAGGEFLTSARSMASKTEKIKAYIFDWDGVFNNAEKSASGGSNFNEADSMGTNLLRFSHYHAHGKIPLTVILSGEKNATAFYLSTREHFNLNYYKNPHKIDAVNHICELHKMKYEEIAFVFDDVLDLSVAAVCGIRIMVNRKANPLFKKYVSDNGLADYITASESGHFAVREACELIMGLNGWYEGSVKERISYSDKYLKYIEERNKQETRFYTRVDNKIIEKKPE